MFAFLGHLTSLGFRSLQQHSYKSFSALTEANTPADKYGPEGQICLWTSSVFEIVSVFFSLLLQKVVQGLENEDQLKTNSKRITGSGADHGFVLPRACTQM